MRALLIGGTGTISSAITDALSRTDWEVWLLNRGRSAAELPENINVIHADINNEEEAVKALDGMTFDTVCDFIGFVP